MQPTDMEDRSRAVRGPLPSGLHEPGTGDFALDVGESGGRELEARGRPMDPRGGTGPHCCPRPSRPPGRASDGAAL